MGGRSLGSLDPADERIGRPRSPCDGRGIDDFAVDGMTLTEIATVKFNHDTRADDHQSVMHASGVTIASRSIGDPSRAFTQLIASAGLSPSERAACR